MNPEYSPHKSAAFIRLRAILRAGNERLDRLEIRIGVEICIGNGGRGKNDALCFLTASWKRAGPGVY